MKELMMMIVILLLDRVIKCIKFFFFHLLIKATRLVSGTKCGTHLSSSTTVQTHLTFFLKKPAKA